jgi:hypothetical protein
MIGRQSSLLLTNHDLIDIEEVLRRRGDVQFLADEPAKGDRALEQLETLIVPEPGKTPLTCYLAPTSEFTLRVERLNDVKVHIPVDRSEIIEFSRPYYPGEVMRHGRVYYTPIFFDAGEFHDKNPAFVKWAERVVAAIRRSLTYDKKLMSYLGDDAATKIASGEVRVIN